MADPGDQSRANRESEQRGERPRPFESSHQLECLEWCPTCSTENPPGAKFCIECGTALGAGGAGVTPPQPGPGPVAPAAPNAPTASPAQPASGGGLFGGQLPGAGAPAWGPPIAGALPE